MPALQIPQFERVSTMWRHYWARDRHQRPLVINSVTRPGSTQPFGGGYADALTGGYDSIIDRVERTLAATEYLGETVPYFSADHGPDQFAAFLGTDLEYKPDSPDTNWAHPIVDDWSTFPPLQLRTNSTALKGITELSQRLATNARGRYAVSVADLHSNMDALAALRGPQDLCMDLLVCPELVREAMKQVRQLYRPVYERLYNAGNMAATGTVGWAPFYCEQRFATIQCDFICMVSPETFREMIMPALEEEASYLDHCVYHLDGPGALKHLDDILTIKDIDVIQWVPGAGQKPQHEWLDVLKRCQKAGKGLQLWDIGGLDRVKMLSRELSPEGLVYCCWGCDRDETLRIIDWLDTNT